MRTWRFLTTKVSSDHNQLRDNEILKFLNNECIEYKVALGNSIQKCILRVYITKYSNLGRMNSLSIRWSTAASKLERGRPCCTLLDALVLSNLATWCPSWGESPWLATTTTTPRSRQPTLSLSAPGCWLAGSASSSYLSTMYPFLACSYSPARPVVRSPQLVLLLLALIASLAYFAKGYAANLATRMTCLCFPLRVISKHGLTNKIHFNVSWQTRSSEKIGHRSSHHHSRVALNESIHHHNKATATLALQP
jgi:hypothetical protein